jgi:hypothetical protein
VAQPARAFVATAQPTGPVRGLVVLASGGQGDQWWSTVTPLGGPFADSLRADGFVVVQLRWVDPWLASAPGEDAGPGHLACRPATVFRWVYDNQFSPLGLAATREGVCGFCISGNSGGASQVSYALSFYGLEPILDAVIPTSGPVHSALTKGCLQVVGEEAYWYDNGYRGTIDSSYGFSSGQGPCFVHDATFVPRWMAESTDTGANDLFYTGTRVVVIVGGRDTTYAPAHARDFAAALERAGTPNVTLQTVGAMGHRIQASADGLSALHDALLATGGGYPRPRGATPLSAALVPAFEACTAPHSLHGEPLAAPSCAAPAQASRDLTIGTPDANRKHARFVGALQFSVFGCQSCESPVDADVRITAFLTDVRNRADLSDYTGDLQGRLSLRITDSANVSSTTEPTEAGTVEDFGFEFPILCAATASDGGSECAINTSANAVQPGSVSDGDRAVWGLGPATVLDENGNVFASQGLFVP